MTTDMETATEIYQRAGQKLRMAREQAGMSITDVMDKTKLTVKVVKALESGEGDIFATPVFVRGQLRSYARILGVDIVPEIQQLMALEAPAPVLEVRETVSPSSRFFASSGQYALYLLVTAALAVPIITSLNWFKESSQQPRPLDGPVATAEAERTAQEMPPTQTPMVDANTGALASATPATATNTTPDATAATAAPAQALDPAFAGITSSVISDPNAGRQPMAASMTGAQGNAIVFNFRSESWVKFVGADGSVIEQGLVPAGTTKQFAAGQLAKARIGAAEQVSMTVNGQPADITGFTKGSVANLTIGSDGRPVAPASAN